MKSYAIPRGTDKAKVIQVIQTVSITGAGTKEDPVRTIYQYWDFKGHLLAKEDTLERNIEKSELTIATACSRYQGLDLSSRVVLSEYKEK